MPTASEDGVLYNTADGGGLGTLLAPDNLAKIKQLQQANAFSGGVPPDANGNPDFSAMAKTLLQKGDYANAGNFLTLGINQQGIQAANQAANNLQNGTIGGAGGPPAPVAAAPSTKGANSDVVKYIQQKASSLGIDPNTALAVASTEGLRGFDPAGNANLGDAGSSAGPFQLHYGGVAPGGNAGAGLGDDFTAATKLDARDPSTWKDQVDFALNHAAKNGWGAFHGAARAGIAPMAGIGQAPSPQMAQQAPAMPAPQAVATADGIPLPPPKPASLGGAPDQVASNDDGSSVSGTHPYAQVGMPGGPGNGPDASIPDPNATPPQQQAAGDPALPPAAAGQVAGPGVPSQLQPAPVAPNAPSAADAVAIDPTMGGLLKGQWVGNPGGYVAALRAEQIRLSPFAPKAADAYGKQADTIERGIERNNIVTPMMKNYQIAKQQGYPGTMMQFNADGPAQAEAAKIAAGSTPAALRSLGQRSSARANAEEDVRNQNTLVPVANPDGSVGMTTKALALKATEAGQPVMKSLPGYVTTGQQGLATKLADGTAAFQERQVSGERLDAIANLLSQYQTGANSQAFNDAAAKLRSFGIPIKNSDTINPAAMQQFGKNAYANVLSSMREQGNKQFVSEMTAATNSNANTDLQPEANAAITAQMQGIQAYHNQNFKDYAKWYANGGASQPNDAQFQIGWAKEHPLQPFITSAANNIAPMGVALPPKAQLVDGKAYMVKGQYVRWNAGANGFVPSKPPGQ